MCMDNSLRSGVEGFFNFSKQETNPPLFKWHWKDESSHVSDISFHNESQKDLNGVVFFGDLELSFPDPFPDS